MLIVQIVPKLPPAIDGLGDYALNLARRLRSDFGIDTHFLVGDPSWKGKEKIEEFNVTQISQRNAASFLSSLPQNTDKIILHYVGYGYAKRGCPFWLIKGLEEWRRQSQKKFIVTMFHEVYAAGRPFWTSAFWLFPLQKNLASRLVKLCDRALTSKESYADILANLSQRSRSEILSVPVFSNIGEPTQIPLLCDRQPNLVVFGSRSNRLRVYQQSTVQLTNACQKLEIQAIWDIGPPTGLNLSSINNVPIVPMGIQGDRQISQMLLNSRAGFFDYPTAFLAKSGVFAAYCAHGILPVSSRSSVLPVDGIESGKHYWVPGIKLKSLKHLTEIQAIANNAYAWYQTHNLSIQAKIFSDYLPSLK
ncbi:MAG: hypothetical protein SAJ37_13280 [Oscillatoria sp. PMC 1068.18]|nr:hypothetical protein [Oscillatoria sp. PMC 1076.18]MEC4989696.1 hypothetical protein [Oscillatoria sp. PMC 1068.18]